MQRSCGLVCCLLLAAAVCLSGCSRLPTQTTEVNYYPACYEPARKARDFERSANLKTAGAGVGGGILGGLVLGLSTRSSAAGIVGGLAAGTAAAVIAHHVQKAEVAEEVTRAARAGRSCYLLESRQATRMFDAGKLSRREYRARMKEIRDGVAEMRGMLAAVNADAPDDGADSAGIVPDDRPSATGARKAAQARKRKAPAQAAAARSTTASQGGGSSGDSRELRDARARHARAVVAARSEDSELAALDRELERDAKKRALLDDAA